MKDFVASLFGDLFSSSNIIQFFLGSILYFLGKKMNKILRARRISLFFKSNIIDTKGYTEVLKNEKLDNNLCEIDRRDEILSFSIPEEKREALKKYKFENIFNVGDTELRTKVKTYIEANYDMRTEDIASVIDENIRLVADLFICDLERGKVRYNKSLYGVGSVGQRGIGLYVSDYFTFKCMNQIHYSLRDYKLKNNQLPTLNIDDINSHIPFFNSIGVGGFVIVNRGKGDELVLGYRGNNCESGGYWHFSYDETFTPDDKSSLDDMSPDVEMCIKRAIYEEIGIMHNQQKVCLPSDQIIVLNAGVIEPEDDNRFEFEILSFVRICFSKNYTFHDFIRGYRFAKDAELETRCLKFIGLNDIENFIISNKMSPEAKHLAKIIKRLSDNKLILSDYKGYKTILNTSHGN